MKLECDRCILHKNECCLSGEGPKDADILVIGQSPGFQERKEERIFVGPSGQKLNEALSLAGLNRKDIYFTNAVKGFVPLGKTISSTLSRICAKQYLIQEIKEVKPKVIIATGAVACRVFDTRFIANSHFYSPEFECYVVITHHPARILRSYSDKLHNEFKEAFVIAKSLLAKVHEESQESAQFFAHIGTTELDKLGDMVALDLETTGLNFVTNKILTVGLSNGEHTIGFPFEDNKEVFKKWTKDKQFILHNGKFDYKFLKKNDITIKVAFDTMLAHFLIDREAPHALKEISLKYLHTKLTKGTIDFDNPEELKDLEKLSKYAANDAYMCYKVYKIFKEKIDAEYTKVFYTIMMPTLEWLADAELRGVKIDREYVQKYMNQLQYDLKAIESDIVNNQTAREYCRKVGIDELNIRSPKQLKDLIYNYLSLKHRSSNTAEKTLTELSQKYPKYEFLKKIVVYRSTYKIYKTYLKNLMEFSQYDGRVHCSYNQARVPTGRLACLPITTQLITKKGRKSLKDLRVGDEVLTKKGYYPVKTKWNTGKKEECVIKCSTGEVRSSKEHPWLTPGGWKKAEQLKEGDYLITSGVPYARGLPQLLCPDLSYFMGVVLGDGHVEYNKKHDTYYKISIAFDGRYDDHIKYIQECIHAGTVYTQTSNGRVLCINSKKLACQLASLGLNVKHSIAAIPSIIWQSDLRTIKHFLAGLFDADGCIINSTGSEVAFYTTASQALALDIQQLLRIIGVDSRINNSISYLNDRKFKAYKVMMSRAQDIIALDLPLKNTRKMEALRKIKKVKQLVNSIEIIVPSMKSFHTGKKTYYSSLTSQSVKCLLPLTDKIKEASKYKLKYHKIISIKRGALVEMCDIEVEGVHEYIVNGYICHNCSEPNLQNIPKSGALATIVRKAFVAAEGYTLLESDFKAAEFRALANYSKDINMITLINRGVDIHRLIGSLTYLKKAEEITDDERTKIKTVVFGMIYGRGSKSIALAFNMTVKEADTIKDNFFNTFKDATRWIKGVQNFAKKNGYVKTITGRKISLPQVYSKDEEIKSHAVRCSVNYPIQGVVGDFTNLAGSFVHEEIKKRNLDAYVIMNIHDSIIVECKDEIKEEMKQIMREVMTVKIKEVMNFKVKLEVEIKEGKNLAFNDK